MKRCRLKRLNFQIKTKMSKKNKTSDKHEKGNDFIADVSTRFFPDNQLHLKKGSRILNIRARHILKHPEVIINCMEHWEADDPDFGSPEHHDAAYFVNEQEIDQIIEALKDAKRFLNGC